MKVEEYFSQGERYFSESTGEFVNVEEMAPQYALNAWTKLADHYVEGFLGSDLAEALMGRFSPDRSGIRHMLKSHGKAMIYLHTDLTPSAARARLRAAGAGRTSKEGDWMAGYSPTMEVKVRAR